MRRHAVSLGFALVVASLAEPVGAGVLDTPLPSFSDAQPAQLVAVLSTAVKNNNLDIDVVCTNLGGVAADIGLEVFDHDGVRGNTISVGNGAILAVGAGATVTIGTTNTAVLHEDAVITLEAPVVSLANGSARVVATSASLGCTAFAVDKFHNVVDPQGVPPPGHTATERPPPLLPLAFAEPTGGGGTTTSTTSTSSTSTSSSSSTTTTVPTTTSTSTTSTSTTTSSSVTTTSMPAGTSSSTQPPPPVPTTTLPSVAPCAPATGLDAISCFCERGEPAACAGHPVPPAARRLLARTCRLVAQAAVTGGARKTKKFGEAVRSLRQAARLAARAARHGTIASECAKAFGSAAAAAGTRATAP